MASSRKASGPSDSKQVKNVRKPSGRGRGRPSGLAGGMVDRTAVVETAFAMTKSIPVTDLSIVRVAKELGVTPALIHYYLAGGGRDALTSGVMNTFYREVITLWPQETQDWRHNFETVSESIYRAYVRYPGIAIYAASHNRYQLVQEVEGDEVDYGLLVLEKFSGTVRQMGFDQARTGSLAHMLMMFIQSYAHSTVKRRWPGQHAEFLNTKLSELDPEAFPNCHFIRESLTSLNAPDAFRIAMRIIIDGLTAELPHLQQTPAESLVVAPAPVSRRRATRART
ncbi:TetR/AcrR family transcriptional regulator C-terminal domain-containing protein [Paraburkholderia kururiensis]|uniref:TetR/AcrR family transcriptional regulator C-terminal domain-containing protein n=1 Tax=Paraburkholderia kururiensis TaxID=984307 RepID=UPI001268DA31|nr:TetR/AcrR family transcriptional regulator C-terminal domain-containing protein [Paraburkholderia kururiensis]